jgi:predicted ATP-binding protein involved in virulence
MYLGTLAIKNYRSFVDSSFTFDRKINLIIGINGSGKSTLLSAIKASVVPVMRGLADDWSTKIIETEDVRFESEIIGHRVRFERRFPASIHSTGELFNTQFKWFAQKNSGNAIADSEQTITTIAKGKISQLESKNSIVLPLVAFYGVQRSGHGQGVGLGSAASEKLSKIDGYKMWFNAFLNRDQLENWIIGKTLERLQLLSEGEPASKIEDDELAIVNGALRGCIPEFVGLRYDMRLRTLMAELSGGRATPFSAMSDGQQNVVALVADVARRMCILNPHLGDQILTRTDGIVAIDELDIHLHPSWQRNILKTLRLTFPLLQVFATSHSPQMVGGLSPDEVIVLKDGKPSRPQFTYGLDVNELLEDVMNAKSREPEIEESINQIFEFVEAGDIARAKLALGQLKMKAPGLPDYSKVDALIRRKEIIGR